MCNLASKKKTEVTTVVVYHVGGVFDGMLCITNDGPQAAADMYFNQTGDEKSVEIYKMTLIDILAGKKMSKKKLKRLIVL